MQCTSCGRARTVVFASGYLSCTRCGACFFPRLVARPELLKYIYMEELLVHAGGERRDLASVVHTHKHRPPRAALREGRKQRGALGRLRPKRRARNKDVSERAKKKNTISPGHVHVQVQAPRPLTARVSSLLEEVDKS